jgi:hypothetical protein
MRHAILIKGPKHQSKVNKLECNITLGWKGFTGTNTLAYRTG